MFETLIINVILSLAKLSLLTQTELDKRDYNASNIQRKPTENQWFPTLLTSFDTIQGKGRLPCLWERENWISKTQSGVRDVEVWRRWCSPLQTDCHSAELLESDIPSVVWVHYILTFSIGNMLPHPSLPITLCSVCWGKNQFYDQHFPLTLTLPSCPAALQAILPASLWRK